MFLLLWVKWSLQVVAWASGSWGVWPTGWKLLNPAIFRIPIKFPLFFFYYLHPLHRITQADILSGPNDRILLIQPENLNRNNNKSTVGRTPEAWLFVGAAPWADFSSAISEKHAELLISSVGKNGEEWENETRSAHKQQSSFEISRSPLCFAFSFTPSPIIPS